MKVFPGWAEQGEEGRRCSASAPPPLCSARSLARSLAGSQFGGHEVDVRLDQREERQAPLELRHVLHQRGLETRAESLPKFQILCSCTLRDFPGNCT